MTATITVGCCPLPLICGRPFSLPLFWLNPPAPDGDGTPINITGFTFAAAVKWWALSQAADVPIIDAAAGAFTVDLTADQTATVQRGEIAKLHLTVTDAAGNTHDFIIPLDATVP